MPTGGGDSQEELPAKADPAKVKEKEDEMRALGEGDKGEESVQLKLEGKRACMLWYRGAP